MVHLMNEHPERGYNPWGLDSPYETEKFDQDHYSEHVFSVGATFTGQSWWPGGSCILSAHHVISWPSLYLAPIWLRLTLV